MRDAEVAPNRTFVHGSVLLLKHVAVEGYVGITLYVLYCVSTGITPGGYETD
jgi:hypothetical protein